MPWKKQKKSIGTIFGTKKPMNMLNILFNSFLVCQKVKIMLRPVAADQGLAIAAADATANAQLPVREAINKMLIEKKGEIIDNVISP